MIPVDLTGVWRDGIFYKVKVIRNCRGCEFMFDPQIDGRECYEVLACTDDNGESQFVFINTDDESVAAYLRKVLDAAD
jgi:hypothetical protein